MAIMLPTSSKEDLQQVANTCLQGDTLDGIQKLLISVQISYPVQTYCDEIHMSLLILVTTFLVDFEHVTHSFFASETDLNHHTSCWMMSGNAGHSGSFLISSTVTQAAKVPCVPSVIFI